MAESDTTVGFLLLENGPTPTGTELATHAVGDSAGRSILIAMDADRCRHLLVPSIASVPEDHRSRALKVVSRTLTDEGVDQSFVDLWCGDTRLGNLFERVVDDVLARITDGADPTDVCHKALEDWRDLLIAAQGGTALEDAIGLIGELEILSMLADATTPAVALSTWWGPAQHVHDFYSEANQAIEVKTTRTLDGDRVEISNLDQLDPQPVRALHLAVVRVRRNVAAPTLDDRIRSLVASGFSASDLIEKVGEAGHAFEGPVSIDTRFAVRDVRVWEVHENFPGLRRSALSDRLLQGVGGVKYELRLDAAGRQLGDSPVLALLKSWGTA